MRSIVVDPDRTADDVVRNLVFSADGRRLGGVLGERGTEAVRAWRYDLVRDEPLPNPDDEDYEIERERDAPDPVWNADVELLAEYLLDGSGHPGLRIVDLWAKPQESAWLMFGGLLVPTAYAFSPDGGDLYAACWNEAARPVLRWSVAKLLAGEDPADADVDEVADSVQGNVSELTLGVKSPWLACGFHGEAIDLIDPTGERLTRRLKSGKEGADSAVRGLQFSPRGDRLLSVGRHRLSVWDVEAGRAVDADLRQSPGGRSGGVAAAAFTPDGGVLAVTADGDVVTLDPVDFAEVRRLDFGVGPLWGVAVAADGLTAAVGAANGRAVVFDLE